MKISFIRGAGRIGSLCAALLTNKYDCEAVILDNEKDFSEGIAYDIAHSAAISGRNSKIGVCEKDQYSKIKDSDIVVITAGVARSKDVKSRDELLLANLSVIDFTAKIIDEFCPNAFVIIVTNPLDIMCYRFKQQSKMIKPNKIVGMAGVLDSARLKYVLSKEFKTDLNSVDAKVIGEHGESMVCVLSNSTINGVPFYEFAAKNNINDEKIKQIQESVIKFGYKIGQLTGKSASIAPAFGVLSMVESYIENLKRKIPCSVFLNGEYGINDIFFGTEAIIGSNGVEDVIETPLNKIEKELVDASYQKILSVVKTLHSVKN